MSTKKLQRCCYSLPLLVLTIFASFTFSLGRYHEPEFPSASLSSKNDHYSFRRTRPFGRASALSSSSSSSSTVFNVDDFGAQAEGTDDSQAFNRAWIKACSSSEGSVVYVPRNKVYYLKPIKFSGPCKSFITMRIDGVIKASPSHSDYKNDGRYWIVFEGVQDFRVEGGGTIDGNGRTWWQHSCKVNKALPCKHAPTSVTFIECTNVIVTNLEFKDAQQMHLTFQKCLNVKASNLKVIAPGDSPNTDGIHVSETKSIQITNCVIATGDDCISIVSGSENVRATGITCGPGHGISIGSLGADNSEAEVSNVYVDGATFTGTTNGVRIKTWQGGSGYAKNIMFQNILMKDVSNPIIIDQNYCDQDEPCHQQNSAVQISNVQYRNIRGTSDSEVAVKLDCSENVPCEDISLLNVDFVREGDGHVEASCENVRFNGLTSVSPSC